MVTAGVIFGSGDILCQFILPGVKIETDLDFLIDENDVKIKKQGFSYFRL